MLVARRLRALVYRRALDARRAAIAGVLQATSLPFIVAATAIGLELGLIDAAESAALIGAAESAALIGVGLLSALVFPVAGSRCCRRGEPAPEREREAEPAPLAAM